MYKIFVFIVAFLSSISVFAQEVLLDETVQDVTTNTSDFGPNLKKYRHFYFDWGMPISKSEGQGAELQAFKSSEFELGLRFKRKISKTYSVGWAIYYNNLIYRLKQDGSYKLVPNKIEHQKESLRFNSLGLEFYNRLNFGRRGNSIGKFIDFGAYCNWAFSIRHIYTDPVNPSNTINYQASDQKVIITGLDYVNHFNYGLRARMGVNRYVLVAEYRLSNHLNGRYHNSQINAELPRLSLALQIGLHR